MSDGAMERLGDFVQRDDFDIARWCRMERALAVMGTRSALLIARELFFGATRFDEIARRTGMSEAVVAGRIKELAAADFVRTRPYRIEGQRARSEYVLTERGRALFPVLVSLVQWGELLEADTDTGSDWVHRDCGGQLQAVVRCECGTEVESSAAAIRLRGDGTA